MHTGNSSASVIPMTDSVNYPGLHNFDLDSYFSQYDYSEVCRLLIVPRFQAAFGGAAEC